MTKFHLFLTSLSLFSLTTLTGSSFAQIKPFNQQILQAQETTTTTASCPLEPSIAVVICH